MRCTISTMNFIIDPSYIPMENVLSNIRFLEKKQNIIMQGEFTKIMYSTEGLTMNGVYVLCPLQCSSDKPNSVIHTHTQSYSNTSYHKPMIFFQPNHPENYKTMSYFHSFEKTLIDLYMEHTKLYHPSNKHSVHAKTCIYSLYNQLAAGCTKVYRDYCGADGDCRPSNSGSGKSGSGNSCSGNSCSSNSCSGNSSSGNQVYSIKISGVWETSSEIGITYKFIEMNRLEGL